MGVSRELLLSVSASTHPLVQRSQHSAVGLVLGDALTRIRHARHVLVGAALREALVRDLAHGSAPVVAVFLDLRAGAGLREGRGEASGS